jgi:tetrahydromethanopterin S-methyltransferase subunit F
VQAGNISSCSHFSDQVRRINLSVNEVKYNQFYPFLALPPLRWTMVHAMVSGMVRAMVLVMVPAMVRAMVHAMKQSADYSHTKHKNRQ